MNTTDTDYSFASLLLNWYAQHGRDLPWRRTSDPYRIWVSEIILQQTRVAQGMDYFSRFIERFPSVEALARAPLDDVLRCWQGLGYYSRARNLHAAACQVAELGAFPATFQGLRQLRGVGEYTAAAIASFAFGLPHAVVDGNVYRVLSRSFGIDLPIDSTEGKRTFAALAQELLPPRQSAAYNQAIMDLGAMVCTPQSPQCEACPLAQRCVALAGKTMAQLPVKQKKAAPRDRYFTCFYLICADEIALQQRKGRDIWQGLYQLPLQETAAPMTEAEVRALPWMPGAPKLVCRQLIHKLTHQTLHADCYALRCDERPDIPAIWVKKNELDAYAVPRLMEIILENCAKSNL